MSTKSSIAYGSQFHFYHEVWDDTNVYLTIEALKFEASQGKVTLAIPKYIWEVIRLYPVTDLSLAEMLNG